MEKTTLHLPDDLKSAIKRAAAQQGVSERRSSAGHCAKRLGAVRRSAKGALLASGHPIARQADELPTGFGERCGATDLIVDTSALRTLFDASEPDQAAVEEVLAAHGDLLIVSPM